MEYRNIGFIGAGNMASAVIFSLFNNSDGEIEMFAYDVDTEKCEELTKYGVTVCESPQHLVKSVDIIVLAVKPQTYEKVLEDIKGYAEQEQIIVTMAAGISTDYIKKGLGFDCKVVRIMPNTPLLLGCGAIAICGCPRVTDSELEFVTELFSSCGIVESVDESDMNKIISVNGSSPAYVYLFAKAVIQGAVKQGIDADVAERLFLQTLAGSTRMMTETDYSIDELIKMVASPGGTTLKAIESLDDNHFGGIIFKAMEACTNRAEELKK